MTAMSIIEVNRVTKEHQLGTIQSLKTTALNQWRRLTGQPVEKRAPFKALDDVTFLVEQGEVADIFCTNGTGKSNENWCLTPFDCSSLNETKHRYRIYECT